VTAAKEHILNKKEKREKKNFKSARAEQDTR
jgi:hypothetical protein